MPRDPIAAPPETLIRPARREDAAALVRMIRRLAAPLDDLGWDVLGAEPWATALLAEAGSLPGALPVGCAVLGRRHRAPSGERCLEVESLLVEPAWRGRGVGRALLEAVMRRAAALGCSRVTVATAGEAARFYARLGFAPLPGSRILLGPALEPECPPTLPHPEFPAVVPAKAG